MQRKEIPRFRPSYSAEHDLRSYRAPSSSPPSYPSSSPPYPSSSPPRTQEAWFQGHDDSIAGPSGNESGDDYGRMAGSGYLDLSYLPQSLSHLVGAYGNISLYPNQTNVYRTGQQRNLNPDVSGLQPLGIDHKSSLPPDSAPSPEEAALAGYSSAGARTAAGDKQWSNSLPMVNSMPDPIEPMFKTLKERELIRHYAGSSTELIMAVNTSAALNPVLSTALPIVLSVPPRTNAPVEALRLSLLGVAAIHQSFLHSHSNSNRQLLEKSTVTNMRAAEKGAPLPSGLLGDEGEQDAAENLRLALLLRQNASKCLYFACQSLEGSLHDAALAASASIALIDIFAGGNDYESNLALAKQLIAIRGGPENIVATNTPARTSFGGGVIVSPARLALEIIAVYDVFGSLTTGEEPAYLGHGDVRWWLDGNDQNYHKYSVEKTFAMSRMCIHLVANVSSLLSRLSAVEGTESFTKIPPDPKNVPASALNLHTEATALLGRLEEEANSDAARAPRTATGGASGSLGGGGLGEDEIPLPPNASPDYPQTTAQRIEHGTQAHLLAFQIVLLRLVFHMDRHDRRVQSLANEIITRCHTSATSLQMPIDLTWPAIIAACELDVQKRGLVSEIFEGFRKKSCYDIDTAEQIVNRVWRRVDQNQPQANWKSVLEDDRMRVLLI
ncbi:fungal-specific transcription factor domain-containing protein [Cantharellus anzutake]|uniref:fungal-specific transcription factor domain-containing protein n=1 Tax=Cantharellus anzutake TaxID=1750568 RepID=UPI0019061FBB|nr:fungal-specific transcription factor domain-containing protein [Cantharellus anzutake]KAF8332036.1 fungal-specific transcription factor domain-containing protein [Cantharellus anzutake]